MTAATTPSIVLAAYAEPLAEGRRVLVVGPATSPLSDALVERGARLVHVCDPDPLRLAEAQAKNRSGALSFSALTEGTFALRDGAFDLCIVEDAGIASTPELMKRVRRALTPRGVALVASANPEARVPLLPQPPSKAIALDYYALYDAVRAEFSHVRMLGQAPFVGYVVADFAPDGTPEPSLDTAFVPGGAEEPELFIALAAEQPIELDAFAVVQLPYRSVLTPAENDGEGARRARAGEQSAKDKLKALESERADERKLANTLRDRLSELELSQARALEQQQQKLQQQQQKLEQQQQQKLEQQANELRQAREKLSQQSAELATKEAKATELLGELRTKDGKLREQAAVLGQIQSELAQQGAELAAQNKKLREAEARIFARDTELGALRQELDGKARDLEARKAELVQLNARLTNSSTVEESRALQAELDTLEAQLQERGEAIRVLERQLREAERIGRELVRQLPSAAAEDAPRPEASDALAQKLAKSQADLVATRWALEAALRRANGATPNKA